MRGLPVLIAVLAWVVLAGCEDSNLGNGAGGQAGSGGAPGDPNGGGPGDPNGGGSGGGPGDPNGGDAGGGGPGDPGGGDGPPGDPTGGDDAPPDCVRTPRPADQARFVVISHPYDAAGGQAPTWRVLRLAVNTLTAVGDTFELGRAVDGVVAFTPDGEIGMVAQEDGTLGVFALDDAGGVRVIHTDFGGELAPFYASEVVIDPAGSRAYVVDENWRNNGGGLYVLRIACDGSLVEDGMLGPSKLAHGLRFVPGRPNRGVLAARDVLDSQPDDDLHLLALAPAAAVLDGVPSFADPETFFAGMAITADGRYALLGDNNEFFAVSHRVAVVEIAGDALYPVDVLMNVNDPVDIVASPFDDLALVLDGYGNGVHILRYDPTDAVTPFTNVGEPAYTGASPQLPSRAVVIARGALTGRVLLAENVGVRQLQLDGAGGVADLGLTGGFGGATGLTRIVGAIGVQP